MARCWQIWPCMWAGLPLSTCSRLAGSRVAFHVCQQHGEAGTHTRAYEMGCESILPAIHVAISAVRKRSVYWMTRVYAKSFMLASHERASLTSQAGQPIRGFLDKSGHGPLHRRFG